MPDRSRRRSGKHRLGGRRRSDEVAVRLGRAVREVRGASGLKQREVAAAAGVSQSWISNMERGRGRTASLETWCSVADALGLQLVSFLENAPGADRPRDYAHLIRQELVLRESRRGEWLGAVEEAMADGPQRLRFVDVLLRRPRRREIAVIEIWNWLDDVGEALRGFRTKLKRTLDDHPEWIVSGVMVLRATARNRELVSRLNALFSAGLPGPSAGWLQALTDPSQPMPSAPAVVWTDVGGTRLFAARHRTRQSASVVRTV